MPPLPNANSGSPYPPVPSQPFGAGAGYPPVHQHFEHPNLTPGYSPQSQFPTPSAGSMPHVGGYPQQQMPHAGGYPQQQLPAAYPNQTNNSYPSSQGYSGHAGFQQSSSSTPSYGYPSMVNVFNEMQGHIKDTRKSKVCVCSSSHHAELIIIIIIIMSENTNNNHIVISDKREKNTHTINA